MFLIHFKRPCYDNCWVQYPKECVCFTLHKLQVPLTFLLLFWNAEDTFSNALVFPVLSIQQQKRRTEAISEKESKYLMLPIFRPLRMYQRHFHTKSHFNNTASATPLSSLAFGYDNGSELLRDSSDPSAVIQAVLRLRRELCDSPGSAICVGASLWVTTWI